MTVLSVIGTRPEAIKMAPVITELSRHSPGVHSLVCVTGQHRELLDPMLKLFGIKADYDLGNLPAGKSLAQLTAVLLERLDVAVGEARPDWILALGDTTTVLATSLVAHYHQVPFGHLEAGLRTGDKLSPFPEEMNRKVADGVADAHFAPTERARENLLREGVDPGTIHVTGNTVIDALLDVAARPFDWEQSPIAKLVKGRRIVLVTVHRREHFGLPLQEICEAIKELATDEVLPDIHVVFPVHLNPNVSHPVRQCLAALERVSLVDPLDYLSMVHVMKRASVVLTDSGGIQEEAPSLGVPVIVLRASTERAEGVELGLVRLVGTDRGAIIAETRKVLSGYPLKKFSGTSPYGDGRSAARIVSILLQSADTMSRRSENR